MTEPIRDRAWLLNVMPDATQDQIEQFIERVGMKLDHSEMAGADVYRARDEAFRELCRL